MRFSPPLLAFALTSLAAPGAAQCGTTFEAFHQSIAPVFEPRVGSFATYDPDGPGPLGEQLIIAGDFFNLDGQPLSYVVTYDPSTGGFANLGSITPHSYFQVTASADGRVAVLYADGFSLFGILEWDGTTWTELVAVTAGPFGGGGVSDIAYRPNGDLIVGGSFNSIANVAADRVASWNGTNWRQVGGGLAQAVLALDIDPAGQLVAGTDASNGTAAPVAVYRFDGSDWQPTFAGSAGHAQRVQDFAFLSDGRVAATGVFEFSATTELASMALWDGADWVLPGGTLIPVASSGSTTVSSVAELPGGDLVLGGNFDDVDGVPADGLVRWDGSTWTELLPSWLAASTSDLRLGPGGDLWVGGQIFSGLTSIEGGLGRVLADCKAATLNYGSGGSGSVGAITLNASSLPWIGSTFLAHVAGLAPAALPFSLIGFSADDVPLPLLNPDGSADSSLLLVPELTLFAPLPSGSDVVPWSLPLPELPGLVGISLYLQALSIEVDDAGELLLATSNGLQVEPGQF